MLFNDDSRTVLHPKYESQKATELARDLLITDC
jgi:hypothetical protein